MKQSKVDSQRDLLNICSISKTLYVMMDFKLNFSEKNRLEFSIGIFYLKNEYERRDMIQDKIT